MVTVNDWKTKSMREPLKVETPFYGQEEIVSHQDARARKQVCQILSTRQLPRRQQNQSQPPRNPFQAPQDPRALR